MSGTTQAQQSYVKVSFSPDPGFELNFDGFAGHEELGRPFQFQLALTTGKWKGDVESLVGATATVKWLAPSTTSVQGNPDQVGTGDASVDHYFHGIVARVTSEGLARGAFHYTVELRPWIWLLSQIEDCRIFQNMSPFDIILKLFREAGFSDFSDKRQGSSGDTELEYCVQYRETTLDFVTRLMEEYGLYYYFEHDETTHTLIFADDPNSHTELSDAIPFTFDRTEYRTVEDHVWEWISDYSLHSGKYMVRDYNFTTPSADLSSRSVKPGEHTHSDYEVYEYPGPYGTTDLGQKLADVRMQSIAAGRSLFRGVSNSRKLLTGWKYTLKDHTATDLNRAYLLVRTEVTAQIGEGMSTQQDQGERMDTYRVAMHAIPSDVNFRLPRKTRRPMIRGPQTAVVVAESDGDTSPYTDQYGRIKVKFYWDREETSDANRTCWIRVAHPWGGGNWGAMVIPRPNMEVVVEFLEGNPDRPLITGVVYNANQEVPYALPGQKWRTTLKSNTTSGGFNEMRMDDTDGSEEFYFHAQKDYNREVKNNQTVTVTKDSTTTIQQGNHSTTVSQGGHSLTVSAGDHTITVSVGKSGITAATSITLTSESSSITISPSGIQISAPSISISAESEMTVNGGGEMSLAAGMISIN